MEKIDVTARFGTDGSISPLEFKIQDRPIQVFNIGRQWITPEGAHVLVMDVNQKTYHLFFQLSDLTWFYIRDIKPSSWSNQRS